MHRRLWKHYQIRGFIADSDDYPLVDVNQSCSINYTQYEDMAKDKSNYFLDKKLQKVQKVRYITDAFKSVPLSVLKRFQDFARSDCDLFDYDCSPGYIFEGRVEGDEENNLFSDVGFMLND